jgi:hypothetical protein
MGVGALIVVILGAGIWSSSEGWFGERKVEALRGNSDRQSPLAGATSSERPSRSNPRADCAAGGPTFAEQAGSGSGSEFYDAVFIATVESIGRPIEAGEAGNGIYEPGIYSPVYVRVAHAFSGDVPPPGAVAIVMVPEDTAEPVEFDRGGVYGIVAHSNADGTFSTSVCTSTGLLREEEVEQLTTTPS